jgi:hypothetical protein
MIIKTLKLIEKQTGLKIKLCPHFNGIKTHNGKKYFNIILNEKISESKEFDKIKRFAKKYKTIDIEPNGLKRLSIFPI